MSLQLHVQVDRPEVRDRASILITNPDMLHQSILPLHKHFARILANLRFVIVDEGHAYRCAPGRCCLRIVNQAFQFVMPI